MPLVRCDCGTELLVRQHSLRAGETSSCGCLNLEKMRTRATVRNFQHGLTGHPLFGTWYQMLQRCESPSHRQFKDYGGRGIAVCAEWHEVAAFTMWIDKNLGSRPDGSTLDRIDNDGNYEPGNVRWATRSEQRANRRK